MDDVDGPQDDHLMKPLWKVLFADDGDLLELNDNNMVPLREKTEPWLICRNSKGDIKTIDPDFRDDAMEIFTLVDKISRSDKKNSQKLAELNALPKKLKATADSLQRRRWHAICEAGFVGTPDECPEYINQCQIYSQWQTDKYDVAQKTYFNMLDELRDLQATYGKLVDTLIHKAHGVYLAELKKQPAPESAPTPLNPNGLDDDGEIDPELLQELERIEVGF